MKELPDSTPPRTPARGPVSRRRFLTTASAVAAPFIVPASALGAVDRSGANSRIGVGIIGLGARGTGHVKSFLHSPETQVLAVCDPYKAKREAARALVEQHYAARDAGGSYQGCTTHADFRELLERPDVDVVAIASPEFWHGLQSVAAVNAGKDVYCEKALTLTVAEGRAVCDAVRRHARVLQVGTQQRSSRNFRFACELARNGYLGDLHTVEVGVPGGRSLPNAPATPVPPGLDYEMWLGPAPFTPHNDLKCTYNWYFIYDYCVGWIQSWGIHHIDIALWGAPALTRSRLTIDGTATFPTDGLANTSLTWRVKARTPAGLTLSFSDNRHHQQGCRFVGDKGWVHVNRSGIRAEPETLLKAVIKPGEERLNDSRNHHGNFLESVRKRDETASSVESGHAATTMTILADIATRTGRTLTWDWAAERFVDDEPANRFLSRPMRNPWCL